MPIEHSRRNVYFWILMTTLLHWVVECDKQDGYSFHVYNTTSCPRNQSEWYMRSSALNCTESNGYMCIPNENITQLLEFCYRYQRIPIEKNICLILKKSTSLVEAYDCKQFRNGCPDTQYWSNEIFQYPSCLSIGNRCFLDEPLCKDEGFATTSLGSTPIPEINENNTWVWILVIGIFLLIVFILVFALITIFRRGTEKTLGEEIPPIEYKNERKESKWIQEVDDKANESLLLPENTKTLDIENIFGDRSKKLDMLFDFLSRKLSPKDILIFSTHFDGCQIAETAHSHKNPSDTYFRILHNWKCKNPSTDHRSKLREIFSSMERQDLVEEVNNFSLNHYQYSGLVVEPMTRLTNLDLNNLAINLATRYYHVVRFLGARQRNIDQIEADHSNCIREQIYLVLQAIIRDRPDLTRQDVCNALFYADHVDVIDILNSKWRHGS